MGSLDRMYVAEEVLWKFKFRLLYFMSLWDKLEKIRVSYILLTTEYSDQRLLTYTSFLLLMGYTFQDPQWLSEIMGNTDPLYTMFFPTYTYL